MKECGVFVSRHMFQIWVAASLTQLWCKVQEQKYHLSELCKKALQKASTLHALLCCMQSSSINQHMIIEHVLVLPKEY